uniref:Transmembrane protein n=1 Tax=Dechloromonas aromatica (strain RCB) TaxID=159087 RepID=Q47IU9_DECAR
MGIIINPVCKRLSSGGEMNTIKKMLAIVAILTLVPILAYLFLLGQSHAYVSDLSLEQDFAENAGLLWKWMADINLPGIGRPGVIHVERLEVVHALRNSVFVFCTIGTVALISVPAILAGIVLTPIGLFTGDWKTFGIGLLCFLASPLSLALAALSALLIWVLFFLQPCTPGYVIVWFLLGAPIAALGGLFGAAPAGSIVIIIFKE